MNGTTIMEELIKERRDWIKDYKAQHGKNPEDLKPFHDRFKVAEVVEDQQVDEKAKDKAGDAKKKDTKKKAKKKDDENDEKNQKMKIGPTETVKKFEDFASEFAKRWSHRDVATNFDQGYDINLAREEIMPDLKTRYTNDIDEMIRLELENIKALSGTKKKGKKKAKKKKKQKKKGKKLKLPGFNFIRDMKVEDILLELISNGLVKKLPPANLTDFMGEFNYIHSMLDNVKDALYDPSMALIRQLVTEYVIFPLGSELVKMRNKEHLRSMLFYGPAGTGKTLVVQAVVTEVNALLIDLSPHNIDMKYSERRFEDKMIASAMVVAKHYQPSIIYIDESEKVFPAKKKSKKKGKRAAAKKVTDPSNPVRIKKPLTKWKSQKFFDDKTRIMIIGCTNSPEEGAKKDFKKFFEKQIYFPFPDYTTRRLMWRNFIQRYHGKLTMDFPLSTLSHISAGYSAGSIKKTVMTVLSPHRVSHMDARPLKIQEFIGPLSQCENVMNDQYMEFAQFTDWITGAEAARKKALKEGEDDGKEKKKKKDGAAKK